MTVSTQSERRLRELLISAVCGHDSWGRRDEPGRSPIIEPVSRMCVERFVEDMATEARDDAARREPDGQYPFAFGLFRTMVTRLLHTAVVSGKSIHEVIREAQRTASPTVSGEGVSDG